MAYEHLTQDERYQIAAALAVGVSMAEIGRNLQRHPSTIARERRRNCHSENYRAAQAQRIAVERRSQGSCRPQITEAMALRIATSLAQRLSPEQIQGRCKLTGEPMISRTGIYDHVHRHGLRHQLRMPKRRRGYGQGRAKRFTDRKPIQQRPAVANECARLGDWELDTVRPSRGRGVIVTMNERATGFVRLGWCLAGKAEDVALVVTTRLGRLKKNVLTLACDRGSEFADDASIEQALAAQVYFADPHSPWQRARNENLNGLLREYFPRNRDFETITAEELQQAEDALNSRPRKRLNFLTPDEVFFNYDELALGA
jgi:IS30 family transposase